MKLKYFIFFISILFSQLSCELLNRIDFEPVISTISVTEKTRKSAMFSGSIQERGSYEITSFGVSWGYSSKPVIEDGLFTESGTSTDIGAFQIDVTNLMTNTDYYFRTYATTQIGTTYGTDVTLRIITTDPIIRTDSINNITFNSANVYGTLEDFGQNNLSFKQHGFCWSNQTSEPTLSNNIGFSELGTLNNLTSFNSDMTNLQSNNQYYVRAYITDEEDSIFYSNVLSYTTEATATPSVTMGNISNITSTGALATGEIISLGTNPPITAYGHCWSSSNFNPTILDTKTDFGNTNTIGNFNSTIPNLSPDIKYYIRAYATNSVGTDYSDVDTFTTLPAVDPIVTTGSTSNISTTSAEIMNNEIVAFGTTSVIEYGLCWSTSTSTPTISDTKISSGTNPTNPLTYNQILTGLPPDILVYVRAYATNSNSTAYGITISFSTLKPDSWNDLSNTVPSGMNGRRFAVSFIIDTKVYIGTGEGGGGKKDDFWSYDFSTGTWNSELAFGGGAVSRAVGFSNSTNTKGYVTLGNVGTNSFLNQLWEFDGTTWTQKMNPGLHTENSIGIVNGTKAYVGTGETLSNGYLNNIKEYDISTNTWTSFQATPQAKKGMVSFVVSNKLYTGLGETTILSSSNDFQVCDLPSGGSWTTLANYPGGPRAFSSSFIINDVPYVGLGTNGSSSQQDFYSYNIVSDSWTSLSNFAGSARYGAISFSYNGRGYIFGGTENGSNVKKDFWEYIP